MANRKPATNGPPSPIMMTVIAKSDKLTSTGGLPVPTIPDLNRKIKKSLSLVAVKIIHVLFKKYIYMKCSNQADQYA